MKTGKNKITDAFVSSRTWHCTWSYTGGAGSLPILHVSIGMLPKIMVDAGNTN